MKKIFTSILLFSIVLTGVSQNIHAFDLSHTAISGTIVPLGIAPTTTRTDQFLLYNSDAVGHRYKVVRTIFYKDASDSTSFCFGGFCYSCHTGVSNASDSIGPGDTSHFAGGGFEATFNAGPANVTRYVHYNFFNIASGASSDTTGFTIQYNYSLGITDPTATGAISNVFPNPASNIVNIKYDIAATSQKAKISFYDMLGKEIKEVTLNDKQGNVKLNTSDFDAGIYFYSFIVDDKIITTKKLIITK